MFQRKEGDLAGQYKFGIVQTVEEGPDGIVRVVEVKYRNAGEMVNRTTRRSVNKLVLIRKVDELDIWSVLADASVLADTKSLLEKINK